MSVRLTADEAWNVLEAAHTGILTTLRADGMPIALPVWFVALDRRIYVGTPSHTKKVARLRRDSRASFLVDSGKRWAELRAVQLTGHARFVTDPELAGRVNERFIAKYASFATPRAAMPDATRQHYESRERVLIEITADERILSWDNARLTLRE